LSFKINNIFASRTDFIIVIHSKKIRFHEKDLQTMGKEVSNTPVIQTYFIYYKDAEITLASTVMGYQGIVLFVYTSIEVRKKIRPCKSISYN